MTGLRKEKPFEDLRRTSQKLVARIKAEVKTKAEAKALRSAKTIGPAKPDPLQELQIKGKKLVARSRPR